MGIAATATFVALVVVAAISDMRTRRISNRLNITLLLLGLGWQASHLDGTRMVMAVAGVGVGLGLLIVPFALRWYGAGDVKLLAAAGAWLGPRGTLYAGLIGIATAGLISLLMTLRGGNSVRKQVTANLSASIHTLTPPVAPERETRFIVPLGVPLGAAAIGVALVFGM